MTPQNRHHCRHSGHAGDRSAAVDPADACSRFLCGSTGKAALLLRGMPAVYSPRAPPANLKTPATRHSGEGWICNQSSDPPDPKKYLSPILLVTASLPAPKEQVAHALHKVMDTMTHAGWVTSPDKAQDLLDSCSSWEPCRPDIETKEYSYKNKQKLLLLTIPTTNKKDLALYGDVSHIWVFFFHILIFF